MAYDFPFASLSGLAFQALHPENYMEYDGKIFWNGHWYPLVAEDQNPDAMDDHWYPVRSWPLLEGLDHEWHPADDWAYDALERGESFANMSVPEPNKFGDVGGFWYSIDEGEELWFPLTDTGGSSFFVDDTNTIPFADVDDEEFHALYPGRDPLDYVDYWPEVYDMEYLE